MKPTGSKSYLVQYRNRQTGRSRRKTIGPHGPLLSFAQAKELARELLSDVVRGGDPVARDRNDRAAPTVADLAAQFLETHARPKKRASSVKTDEAMLRRFILPKLGRRKVADVSSADLQALHTSLAATPYLANRVLALSSTMFGFAVRWAWRADNPAKGIAKFQEEKRDRWLSDEELERLLAAFDAHPNQVAANAIRLQLLTGARIGEVLKARWKDIDLVQGRWTKPSHHTKQKRTEHLPLSNAAIDLLIGMREQVGEAAGYLFPGRRPNRPLVELKRFWANVTEVAELPGYRIHDNRHTHASHLVSSGMSLAIVGRLPGHTNPSTTQRYAHLADAPLREAAEIMGKKVGTKMVRD